MEILLFHHDDQQATARFMRDIFEEMGWGELSAKVDDLATFFHIPAGEGFLFIVKDNSAIVGTGGCVQLDAQDGLIKRFYLHKDYRGKDLANELLQTIVTKAKSLGMSRMVIDVSKNNARAINFYTKHGFRLYHPQPVALWPESSQSEIFNYYYLFI